MEIKYPILAIILIILVVLYLVFTNIKKKEYKDGSKIANTNYIKNTLLYKKKYRRYLILVNSLLISCAFSIIISILLTVRLTKVESTNSSQYNRDIYLCMDVSTSVDELNLELIDSLKNAISKLKNERFGISIFNTTSVNLIPLTDDYDYVNSVLDNLKKSLNSPNYDHNNDDYFYVTNYAVSGTLEGSDTKGSSLIGDGLASCVYSFSNLDEKRSRIIIFSTDNELAGTPIVSLNKAALIAKNKDIKVFGIGIKNIKYNNKIEFENAILKTNGKFYEHSKATASDIVNDIEKTSKSLLKVENEKKQIDIPKVPFIMLITSISLFIIISRRCT